jgi:GntR family transcriptional regulator, transcriptional repressor for pyruvate dehydrogenase complex
MNNITRFEPRQTKRAFEHIVEQIRNLVYTGVIKPGERLPSERELAQQFQTGRLAVREAFRVLEQMGLLHIKTGQTGGAYINEFNKTVFLKSLADGIDSNTPTGEDIIEARASIERATVGLATQRLRPSNLQALKKNVTEADRLISKGISSAQIQMEFHILLAKAAGNITLETILRSIMDVLKLFLLTGVEPSSDDLNRHINDHKNILKAIEEKKPELAKKLVEKHIQYFTKHFSISAAELRKHKS